MIVNINILKASSRKYDEELQIFSNSARTSEDTRSIEYRNMPRNSENDEFSALSIGLDVQITARNNMMRIYS